MPDTHTIKATTLSDFRRDVFSLIEPDAQPLPKSVAVAYVWPTELCSIGCAHCNFASPKKGIEMRRQLADRAEELVQWLSGADCRTLVVCGGGEPLEEPDFITQALIYCARAGINFEIYTSGTSLNREIDIRSLVREWNAIWQKRRTAADLPRVRLSVDAFHEEKIGLTPLVTWINAIEQEAASWTIALRGVRLSNDDSLERLSEALQAELTYAHSGLAHLKLPSGRQIRAELKGLVFDGRASLRALAQRGLALASDDAEIISRLTEKHGSSRPLGRPLSARLTVTTRRIDLEVHSDGVVHVLESQASDIRLNLFDFTWAQIRDVYY